MEKSVAEISGLVAAATLTVCGEHVRTVPDAFISCACGVIADFSDGRLYVIASRPRGHMILYHVRELDITDRARHLLNLTADALIAFAADAVLRWPLNTFRRSDLA